MKLRFFRSVLKPILRYFDIWLEIHYDISSYKVFFTEKQIIKSGQTLKNSFSFKNAENR